MSCCICRLPFLPDLKSASNPLPEHFAPKGLLTPAQEQYFERGSMIGTEIPGYIVEFHYWGNNMFGSNFNVSGMGMAMVVWEKRKHTLIAMHRACTALFRMIFDIEEDTKENLEFLAAIEWTMGYPGTGDDAGRWAGVRYEKVRPERVDLRSLWTLAGDERPGHNIFDWTGLERLGYGWLMNRPNVFPKFSKTVKPDRLAPYITDTPCGGNDFLTRLPTDILFLIAAFMPEARSLVHMGATCRYTRYLALTTWSPLFRAQVIALRWGMPTASERKAVPEAERIHIVSERDSAGGDWMLYLSHLHRTKSMRVRRWIWALCKEVKRVADAKMVRSGVRVRGTKAWKELEEKFEEIWFRREQLRDRYSEGKRHEGPGPVMFAPTFD
ncbi:hypothetical protein EXIGLDRAFT_767120 [Exidia glandulosa HHB12029]|uniref:F-box domain-containing protein n=1 Tax=Exidia glandulosa HHB12029 TaxID=1314781 RepID=A0A165J8D1_EXIGL|nr:hypothetical protein EXIGLDRAFT_767120 [Exidia glandulosa HHB12029]